MLDKQHSKTEFNCSDCLNCDLVMENAEIFTHFDNIITLFNLTANIPLDELEQMCIAKRDGCEYCDFSSGSCGALFNGADDFFLVTGDNEFFIVTDGNGVFRETKIKFCPNCGRALEGLK